MPNYNTLNFIVPLVITDKHLKIRNSAGLVTFFIRDPLCTITVKGALVLVKQQSESALITLNFTSNTEANSAHVLLRDELIQLTSQL